MKRKMSSKLISFLVFFEKKEEENIELLFMIH